MVKKEKPTAQEVRWAGAWRAAPGAGRVGSALPPPDGVALPFSFLGAHALQVQDLLDRYIEGLKDLHEKNRRKYNVPSDKPPLEVL